MTKSKSHYDVNEEKLINQLNSEMSLTFGWLEDTLQPALDILALKCLVYDQQADIETFENKKGETEVSKKSKERVNKMLDYVNRLDKITYQNNTAQLVVKHSDLRIIQLLQENRKLNSELEAVKKAWEEL